MTEVTDFDVPLHREVVATSLHTLGGELRALLCPKTAHDCTRIEVSSNDSVNISPTPPSRRKQNLLPLPPGEVLRVRGPRCGNLHDEYWQEASEEVNDWLALVISGLNFHYGLCGKSSRLGEVKPQPTSAQVRATELLADEVNVFLDQCGGAFPSVEWDSELKASAVSYTGEEIYPSEPLHLDRLLEGLPPVEAASSVNVLDVCEGWVRQALLDPTSVLKAEEDVDCLPPTPRVWASPQKWEQIASVLVSRKILAPIEYEEIAVFKGKKVMGGLFGVHKGGFKRGEGPQRLVMNMIPSNAIQRVIQGDMHLLPSSEKWRSVALRSGEILAMSSEDLKCCFYVYQLPPSWRAYFALSLPVSRKAVGLGGRRQGVHHAAVSQGILVPAGN